ncbi:hypothetical protein BDZ94DRAFT_1261927 [Collybia nuda]|uniref:F-box domain-containing protein n=1 Tax=Collybia nuda TaxID=64659 RepID=A0A9P5Y2A6_9AGAR|nr:hypothetical protein BDZ94DRAFT_1261927 [Collybia nuda]
MSQNTSNYISAIPAPPRLGQGTSLPLELIVDVLSRLDCKSLSICTQVCKLFNTLINNTASLRLIIELYAAGQQDNFVDPPHGVGLTPSDRLDALKRHQIAWEELIWVTEQRLPMLDGGLWELYGGVLAQNSPNGEIVFRQLPSEIRSIEERDWTIGGFDFIVRDFGMDPSQDLLVLVEDPKWSGGHSDHTYRFHLRTMSTGADHPLALQPVICHIQEKPNLQVSYAIQISTEFLGIFLISAEEENELFIWEWKTGVIESAIVGDEIRSFTFLNDEFIILALLTGTDSYESDNEAVEPVIAIVNFREEPKELRSVQGIKHIFFFRFPTLHAGIIPIRFEIRSDPSPGWTPNSNIRVPFFTAQYNRLYVVSLWLLVGSRMRCVMLFAPSATFLARIQKDMPEDRIYEWSAWGPRGTRILLPRTPPSDIWVCYVNGSRYVTLRKDKKQFALDVYNFNHRGVLRSLNLAGDTDIKSKCVTDARLPEGGTIFQSTVETSLPYRIQTLLLGLKSIMNIAVVCSEDNIIIVDTHVDRNEYRILTF